VAMRILVTFAVDAEFAPWRDLRKFVRIQYNDLLLWRSEWQETQLTVLVTGVGTDAASWVMDLMMRMADEHKNFDICISSGLAGALQDCLSIGDIFAPQSLISERSHADLKSDRLIVDEPLRQQALQHGAKTSDCLFSTDKILVKASQKQACSSRAQSVDMESFEIVKEAGAWGARCVVIRGISDHFLEDLPIDFNRTLSRNHQVSLAKVFAQLAKKPWALPALIRFGRQSRHAASTLAKFLEKYVQSVHMEKPAERAEAAMQ
jgi:adenosylhomocysteine nucleosidase